ncbi:MAG: hypothetical protein K2K86_00455, partial [Muribaculaceae bacterium]|nr:hypothetical protein [Muribaculaceae bacterium]
TLHDCKQSTATINIYRTTPQFKIEIESFRDKVTPLANEQISFKFNIGDHPTDASMIMAMQSKALLSIAPSYFDLNVYGSYFPAPDLSNSLKGISSRSYWTELPKMKYPMIGIPGFNLYGHTFGRAPYVTNFTSRKLMVASAARGIDVDDAVETEIEEALCDEVVVCGYGADMTIPEPVREEAGSDEDSENDTFNYRPSEIPLAFFAPMLSTDAEGRLTYTYTVPDANTAWILKGIAYTPDLKTAKFEREIIASRPVMVQPTLPRFMRYGDTATVSASVMNASNSAQHVTTVVTLLDAENHPLSTHTFTDTIAPNSSATVSTPVTAPLTGTALIYRVKATAGNYTDGCILYSSDADDE